MPSALPVVDVAAVYEMGPILRLCLGLQRPVVAQSILVCQYIAPFVFPIGHNAEDADALVTVLILSPFSEVVASKNLLYFG